ncbi:MAG: hemolysin family protein [Verrucomicrobia bacterium]|nr:hemolysin family protein [Verrucomicrobiota bacterium]
MELLIILALLVANGLFAMAEIALVSARRPRLQALEEQGNPGARTALNLAGEPERLLSTVQIGITLIGVLAGAYGGASLSQPVGALLLRIPGITPELASQAAFALVVAGIAYLSLIVGELVPKNLAMRQPEQLACLVSRPMDKLARLAGPAVWFLGLSTRAVMRLFGQGEAISTGPTREEVHVLLREGSITGVIHEEESEMLEGVLDLRSLRAEEVMQPKPRVTFLQADDSLENVREAVLGVSQEVFPVLERNRDEVMGTVSLRELYACPAPSAKLQDFTKPAVFVPENQPALSLLETLRRAPHSAALVVDEFGTIRGLVTIRDVIEEVVGDLTHTLPSTDGASFRQTGPDCWLADAALEIDVVTDAIPGLVSLVEAEDDPFQTLGGFIMHRMNRLPTEGESFEESGYAFEIVDMDSHRIDKVLIRKLPGETAGTTPNGGSSQG